MVNFNCVLNSSTATVFVFVLGWAVPDSQVNDQYYVLYMIYYSIYSTAVLVFRTNVD